MTSTPKSKVFSRTLGKLEHKIFHPDYFDNLSEFKNEVNAVFLFDEHDQSMRWASFDNMMDDVHWDFYRRVKTTKILLNFSTDYINILDLRQIHETIVKRKVDTSRIYFLVMDYNSVQFVKEFFAKVGIFNITVGWYNVWLKKTPIAPIQKTDTFATFSVFSRNFNKWRLRLFLELQDAKLLKDFKYSFGTCNPYSGEENDSAKIISLLPNVGYTRPISNSLREWIINAPYLIGDSMDKFASDVTTIMANCLVHVLIESHYDQFTNYYGLGENLTVQDFSPGFMTEKTWKALACGVPFISFSTPYFLQDLRRLGFKTFSPFIDESYDTIEDNEQRLLAIVNEINRISKLDKTELDKLVIGCKEYTEYNIKALAKMKDSMKFDGAFSFIEDIKATYAEHSNERL